MGAMGLTGKAIAPMGRSYKVKGSRLKLLYGRRGCNPDLRNGAVC